MRAMKYLGRPVLVAIAATVLLGSQTRAVGPARAVGSCHTINARGVGQDLGGGRTQARIVGGGLLHGTTAGTFNATGSPPDLAIDGAVVFTTKHGTLTVHVAGHFDVATGAFDAAGPVVAATGKLAGATGVLRLNGLEDLSDGRFVEDVTGAICVDTAP